MWKKITQSIHPIEFTGNCFAWALRAARQVVERDPSVRVVHGIVTKPWHPNFRGPYVHAWIETRNGKNATDAQNFKSREEYYDTLGITNARSYSYEEAAVQMMRNQHHGPWHLSEEEMQGLSQLSPEEYQRMQRE